MINKKLQQELRKVGYKGKFDLASLIEACGEDIQKIYRYYEQENGKTKFGGWGASNDEGETEYGETPEIAVAKLYLKLNKK